MTQQPKDPTDKIAEDSKPSSNSSYSSTELSVDEYDIDLDTGTYSSGSTDISSQLSHEASDLAIGSNDIAEGSAIKIDSSSVGSWLSSARANKHMSVTEVANRLKLSPEQIGLLESDDFDRLAAPVFVRGYISSYARLLGLPSEELVDQYKQQSQAAYHVQGSSVDQSQANQPKGKFRFDRLILLGMIVLLAYYAYRYLPWQQWFGDDTPPEVPILQDVPVTGSGNSEPTSGNDENIVNAQAGSPSELVSASTLSVSENSSESNIDVSVASESSTATVVPSDNDIAELTNISSISVTSEDPLLVPAPRSVSATNIAEILQPIRSSSTTAVSFSATSTELYTADGQRVDAIVPSVSTETVVGNTTERRFKLVFTEDCWVEARNDVGDKLLIGTIRKGSTKTFESEGEISFVLGNPNAVKININGILVAQDTYIKPGSGVSRFKL